MALEYQEDIDIALLEKICSLYNINLKSLKFLSCIDKNFVYEYHKRGKKYILRGGTRHSTDQVQAELDWILYLNDYGVKVSIPILSKNNRYLELVENDDKISNIVVFKKAPGDKAAYRNPEVWNEKLWEEMGRTLGKMHTVAVKYNSEKLEFKRINAFEIVQNQLNKYLDYKKDRIVIERFNHLIKKLHQLPQGKHEFGLIQYDFHADNFNIDKGSIIVYDFDDSYYFFYMYDLAACIHEAVWDIPDETKNDFANRFIPSLWKGYSEEFKLERKWLEYLPLFLKWREFDIYSTLVETFKEKTASKRVLEQIKVFMKEFKKRTESDDQIVQIPTDLKIWFPDY